jgi:hypothetical protein
MVLPVCVKLPLHVEKSNVLPFTGNPPQNILSGPIRLPLYRQYRIGELFWTGLQYSDTTIIPVQVYVKGGFVCIYRHWNDDMCIWEEIHVPSDCVRRFLSPLIIDPNDNYAYRADDYQGTWSRYPDDNEEDDDEL